MAQILVIIPYYTLFPPRSGGALRCFHLLQELAREHEVHAVIFQSEQELRQPQNGYRFPQSVRVYSPVDNPAPLTIFDCLPRRLGPALHYRWLRRSWRGPASSILLESYHLVRQILERYRIEVAIFTAVSSVVDAPLVNHLHPPLIRIVNTENIEHHLLAQALENKHASKAPKKVLQKSYNQALWQESHLARFVDAFFACSEDDYNVLKTLNQKEQVTGFIIPNGVDTHARPFDDRPDKSREQRLLFCGSLGYLPNRDGLLWFYEQIWPLILQQCPKTRLVVIGRDGHSPDFTPLRQDPTVDFIGEVEDVAPYYHRAGVSIVPLRLGSGTRLKILESMSLGNPIVSTSPGAQGIEAVDGQHFLLANRPEAFAATVVRLLSDAQLFEQMRRGARALVEQQYDWRVIGQQMNEAIDSLLANKPR